MAWRPCRQKAPSTRAHHACIANPCAHLRSAGGGGLDLLHNAAVIDKAEAREAEERARTVKYVDLSKMDEVRAHWASWLVGSGRKARAEAPAVAGGRAARERLPTSLG